MNFKERWVGYMVVFEGRRGKEKCNQNKISKTNKQKAIVR